MAATAFTTFYLGEAYLLISAELPASDGELLRETVARAAGWLTRNGERHAVISNHLGAASAALHVAHAITGERRFELGRDEYLRSVYKHQSVEGWYGEYGGADPGYQTLTIYFLASTWRSHRDSHLTNSLKSGVRFLKHFIHPDGTLGGEYGSRGTEFYFPAGFEILAREMPDAGSIAAAMRASIVRGATIGPRTVDAPNFQSILNNYVAAARYAEAIKHPAPLPCDSEGEWVFQDAGLLVKSTRRHFVVFGPAKGGILRVYAKRTRSPLFHHCGYWARLKGGAVVSTQYLQAQPVWRHASEELEGEWLFRVVPQKVFSPFVFLLFRLVSLLLVFGVGSGNWLKSLLVEALTRPGKVVPLHLRRRVFFRDESVVVSDTITADRKGGLRVATLHGGDKFSTFHTGSARYFQPGELAVPVLGKDDWAGVLMERGEVTIEIEVGDGGSPSDVGGAP